VSDTTENSAADSASTEEKAPRRRAPRRATTTEPLATAEAVTASATVTGSESARSSDASEPAEAPRRGRGKKIETDGAADATADTASSQKSAASSAEADASSATDGDSTGTGDRPARSRSRSRSRNTNGNGNQNGSSSDGDADVDGGAGDRSNRNRQRDRRRGRGLSEEIEPEILEDDVLLPIGGILDVLENYAFVRTAGYLPGANDVYVSLGQVKKYNLRRGDAIVGSIKQPREGENFGRQKFNALVRIDSINGQTQEEAATRDEFAMLTPLYPQERLRLETTSERLTGRVIDVIAPVGKGQRGLVVGGPSSGKSAVLLQIA
jgi:transcription termination factor Rho